MQSTENMIFSGMKFRNFGADNCYRIEESQLYQKSLRHLGFKAVEFVTYRSASDAEESRLIFVEAKTSLRQKNAELRFVDEIANISQKFIDSLQIVCGIWHGGRKGKVPLPVNFDRFRENGNKIVFVLVVKNSDKKDLLAVAESISKKLLKEIRLWRFDVKVLNEELAQKESFVLIDESNEPEI